MSNCLFCKIIQGEIPTDFLYENDQVVAFRDINPQAPFHALIIPKQHIATLNELNSNNAEILGEMYLAAQQLAKQAGYDESGYRTVINCGKSAGQMVFHIHLHLLAGRSLSWPPG